MELSLNENKTPTLCLNMIVKNESKIITRLFDSVLPLIDCYCICDTGSTDNTIEIITTYFESKNIPGKVITEPFKNFCHNRSFSLMACLGMSDYILLMDADMVLQIKDFDKSTLGYYDSFSLCQGNDSFYYQNMRIVRNNGLYSYVGVTHEYINTPSNNQNGHIEKNKLFILDIGDGGAKHDKFERDIRLLTEGIKEDPNNVRYHFYLANSYHDCGKFDEAIEFYKKRIQLGGWIEEIFYSHFRIGMCHLHKERMNDAICAWMESYDCFPQRLEGIYEVIKHYRVISKHKLCKLFYDIAIEVLNKNHNREGYLFLHDDVYKWRIFYEYTIFASYLGIKNINNEIIKVFNNTNDGNVINNVLSNMKFYKDIIQPENKIVLDNAITFKVFNDYTKFNSSSSCIIKNMDNSGYLLNVRYVNYYINEHGRYLNCEKNIITKNKFVELDNDFNVVSEKWFNLPNEDRLYIGVEDVRIYHDDDSNQLLFMGTGYHQDSKLGIVKGIYDTNSRDLKYNEIKASFNNADCEKNWVFFNYKKSTHVIYDWNPLKICKIDDETNLLNMVESKQMPSIFSRVRGSTCGFKYIKKVDKNTDHVENISLEINEIEHWFVTHIVSYEQPRHYYHMIVVFDENMNLKKYTAPFKFEGEPIEYCLGIVVEDERVILSYSNWDRTTKIGVYGKKYIDAMLKYN